MIKLLRKMYISFLSIFDREFVARALNTHHPSELRAWDTFNTTLRKDYDEYCSVREELREWHWLMRKFRCQTIQEFEQVINDLCVKPNKELDEIKADADMMVESMKNQVDFMCKNRNPADPQYVDEWFRFKKMF